MARPFGDEDLEIEFPCRWSYTLFGTSSSRLEAAVSIVLGGAEFDLRPSKRSPGGKYVSMSLEVEVRDDEQRLELFERLADHDDVTFLL